MELNDLTPHDIALDVAATNGGVVDDIEVDVTADGAALVVSVQDATGARREYRFVAVGP